VRLLSDGSALRPRLAALDRSPWCLPALVVAVGAATCLGMWLRIPWLLPALQALAGYPFFASACAGAAPGRAAGRVLIFALIAGAVVTALVANAPRDHYASAVPFGVAYRDDMLAFIRSGGLRGEEATPALFLPRHAVHFVGFVILSFVTAGFGALALGAWLLDYMSYYVGSLVALAAQGGDPQRTLLLSWAPYALVRVLGYALAGSGLATLALAPRSSGKRAAWLALAAGAGLAVVDVIAKAQLAPWYGRSLLDALTHPAMR